MVNDRLNGWKEISSHLQCGVKTARRLEKENGLPVHRLPPQEGVEAGLSPIFAFTDELDRWREEQQAAQARYGGGGPDGAGRTPGAAAPAARGQRFLVGLALVAGLILVVYGSVSWYSRLHRSDPALRSARLEGDAITGYSGDGRVLWTVRVAGTRLGSHEQVILPLRVGDMNGDGREEVVVMRRIVEGHERAALLCLDSNGLETWRYYLDDVPSLNEVAGKFQVWEYSVAARLPGGEKGITVLVQRQDRPSGCLAIVDSRGVLRADLELSDTAYAHAVIDLDRDGADEILVGGLDTAAQEPYLAMLRCGCLQPPGGGSGCRETVRCRFGRTEVSKALGLEDAVTGIQSASEDRLGVEATMLGSPHIAERSYLLDRNLGMFNLMVAQSYKARQRELFQEGRIDHDYSDRDRLEMERGFRVETRR